MGKYSNITDGQKEAIFNKIGGEEVLHDLLSGKVEIVVRPVVTLAIEGMVLVTCATVNNRDCNICHTMFGDGADDTICANGHEIGQQYQVPVR
jgi:hypothetical protein